MVFQSAGSQVSTYEAQVLYSDKGPGVQDVFEFESTTNNAKEFIEHLGSPLYDPEIFIFTTRHPESIFAMGHLN